MITRTTSTLLEGLHDPANQDVWQEFDARYRPVLVAFGRRLGLATEDAADAAQEALLRFVKSYRGGKYQRRRGRLSSWLIGIAQHCIADQLRRRAGQREQRGVSALADLPNRDRLAEIWQAECEQEILRQALRALHEETRTDEQTIRAFELLAIEHLPPADVAARLGMTLNDVYLAKHRCLKRLRALVTTLTAAYEADD